MKARFSKQNLMAYLDERIAYLEKEHKFDPRNGTAQLRQSGESRIVAYGAYDALKDLQEAIEGGYAVPEEKP